MTEEEARKKRCPMVGLVKANEALTGNAEGNNNCIASGCMMWEPYGYWVDESGTAFLRQGDPSMGRKLITGGGCGLKTKECSCGS